MNQTCAEWAWKQPVRTPGERAVLQALAHAADENWNAVISAASLATSCALTPRGSQDVVARLSRAGLIKRLKAGTIHILKPQPTAHPRSEIKSQTEIRSPLRTQPPLPTGQPPLPTRETSWTQPLTLQVWEKLTPVHIKTLEDLARSSGIDIASEALACDEWWSNQRKELKSPFVALKNWLGKAKRDKRNEHGKSGRHLRSPSLSVAEPVGDGEPDPFDTDQA